MVPSGTSELNEKEIKSPWHYFLIGIQNKEQRETKLPIISLVIKVQFFCEHGHNTWNLFLCMKRGVKGKGLKFCCHLPVNSSKNVHKLKLVCIQFQHGTKWLDEPGPVLCISPGVVTRCCGVGIQEVGFHWYLLACHVIFGSTVCLNATVQLRTTAGLNDEEFGLSN